MKATILMTIFLAILVLRTTSGEIDLTATAKARNLILAPFGDPDATFEDFHAFCTKMTNEFFGIDFPESSNFSEVLTNLRLDFEPLLNSESFPFKSSAEEFATEVNKLYKKEIDNLLNGNFTSFFAKLNALQRQLFTFLMAKNLSKENYIGKLNWNAGIYSSLPKNFRNAAEKKPNAVYLIDQFEKKLHEVLSGTDPISMVYNAYEHFIKNTQAYLKIELEYVLYSVLQGNYKIAESSFALNAYKVTELTNEISKRNEDGREIIYTEMARLLINTRIALVSSKALSESLNQWILHVIHEYMVTLQQEISPLAALDVFRRLLTKELPSLVNRKALGNSLAKIALEAQVFEMDEEKVEEIEISSRIILLASLIVTGNENFFTAERIKRTIDDFFKIMSFSFSKFALLKQISPILFNKIVSDEVSDNFISELIFNIARAIEKYSQSPLKLNIFQSLNLILNWPNTSQEYPELYVPMKIANGLLAKANGVNLILVFEDLQANAGNLKKLLETEEFEKLDRIIQHLWAIDSHYNVYEKDLTKKKYVDWLFDNKFSAESFDEVVKIRKSEDKFVQIFEVNSFALNFLEDEDKNEEFELENANEEENEPSKLKREDSLIIFDPEAENPVVDHSQKKLARKQNEGPRQKQTLAEDEEEISDEPINEILPEDNKFPQQEKNDQPKVNIVKVLKGSLNEKELDFLTNTENLVSELKKTLNFVDDDGVQIEISYTQIVPHDSPCHKSIVSMLSKI